MPSLRSSAAYRIAVSYAAVFAWSILFLGATVYFAIDAELHQRRDREIVGELDRLSREPDRAELLREVRWRAEKRAANQFIYALFNREGDRIAGTLDIAMPERLGLGEASPKTNGQGKSPIRIGAADASGETRVVVAANAEPESQIQRTVLKYFLAAFISLIFISAASGWLLAWHLRKRLRPISATADAIVAGDLGLRVPIGKRGDEFDAAGAALNLMLDRIAGLMENLRQVSSDIAHDLRKPLIRLLSQADRLGQGVGAEDRVLDIGDEMLALFAGILRIAEVEGGGLERSFQEFDLSALMTEMAESFAPALVDAGNSIEWNVEPGITVLGSKELLGQVAANLLDNARIHTPSGTTIKLTLIREGAEAKLAIEDNGPGVDEADRDKLLQRFFRADASRTTPGNGLGLSMVAAATHAHGGFVTVEDGEPGLRIVVRIPRLLREGEVEEPPPRRHNGLLAMLRRT